jgi:uncharacterized protein YndB with AHSA1/START domain
MSKRSARHATIVVERRFDAPPAAVFGAWADKAAKMRWFFCNESWRLYECSLDFRVGGREIWRVGPEGGVEHRNDTIYRDIVPDERIIFAYDMSLDDVRISCSLATVEFRPAGKGTRLVLTEHGVYLDGYDDPAGREHGWGAGLANLAKALERMG